MAREFEELESEFRRRAGRDAYLPDLQEMYVRGAPPPDYRNMRVQDPSVDTFEQRWRGERFPLPRERAYPVRPGTRERFLDPTKVISDVGQPSGPQAQVGKNSAEQPYPVELPKGLSFEPPRLPEGLSFEPPAPPIDPAERAALRLQQGVQSPARAQGGNPLARGAEAARGAFNRAVDVGLDVAGRGAKAAYEFAKKDLESMTTVPEAVVGRLGRSPQTGGFDPDVWISNYDKLPGQTRARIFGKSRSHIDAIQGIVQESGYNPLRALPPDAVSKGLSNPAGAASLAQWTRAYRRVFQTRGASGAIASFNIATRNLNNNLGIEVDPGAILKGPSEEE